jgi:hypothetical protein
VLAGWIAWWSPRWHTGGILVASWRSPPVLAGWIAWSALAWLAWLAWLASTASTARMA